MSTNIYDILRSMGSSPSSQQPGTVNFQTHRYTSAPRTTHRLSPDQPQVLVAWSSDSNVGQTVPTSVEQKDAIMVCETCKANFNLLRRKNLCCDCKKHYCNNCSVKEHKRCSNCLLFKLPLTRERLEELKIKDLRQYLNVHDVSTDSCKEKGDLVELTLNLLNARSTNSGPSGLYQGSANISQNRSGSRSGYSSTQQTNPPEQAPQRGSQAPRGAPLGPQPGVPVSGFTNLQNTAERLYNQAHQQFFGVSGTAESGGVVFRTGTTSVPMFGGSQTAHPGPHGPFAPSQEQYSSTSGAQPPQQQPQRAQPPPTQPRPSAGQTTTPPTPAPRETSRTGGETSNTDSITGDDQPTTATEADSASDPPAPKRRASLKDISKAEDIGELTIRQLKEILVANFVDYKGCVERYELHERVTRLYADREGIKAKEEKAANADGELCDTSALPSEEDLCRICMDATIDCVLLECGHMVTCTVCGKQMNECPICRQYVIRCVHIFRS